jgi:predicted nucleic acid-binding protein
VNVVFVDTSALYALLDADDSGHAAVQSAWTEILQSDTFLVTSNYILVESSAILQNRIGSEAVRVFQEDIVPLLDVRWIAEAMHQAAASALLVAGRRKLSLVDCVSFEVMRQGGIRTAFTLDSHFNEQGFEIIPR